MPEADLVVADVTVQYRDAGQTVRPLDRLVVHRGRRRTRRRQGSEWRRKDDAAVRARGAALAHAGNRHVRVDGRHRTLGSRAARAHRRAAGMVFQSFNLVPSLTAAENVSAPLVLTGMRRRPARARGACGSRAGRTRRPRRIPARDACPADSSSVSRSHAPSSASPRCCWPTSRPRISTRRTPTPSCGCCVSSCDPDGSSWSRRTMTGSSRSRTVSCIPRAPRAPDVGAPGARHPVVGALARARPALRPDPLAAAGRRCRGRGCTRPSSVTPSGSRKAPDSSPRRMASSATCRGGRTVAGWCRPTSVFATCT